jgi:hypothetical protein
MKRRAFIKNSIMGTIGVGIMPTSLFSSRDCVATHPDILGT